MHMRIGLAENIAIITVKIFQRCPSELIHWERNGYFNTAFKTFHT